MLIPMIPAPTMRKSVVCFCISRHSPTIQGGSLRVVQSGLQPI
jgi:hypothetical protein